MYESTSYTSILLYQQATQHSGVYQLAAQQSGMHQKYPQ